jgi:hemerythrin
MPLTLWTDECEVGINSLDADHIIIFSLINHVDDAIRSKANTNTIRSMLRVLIYFAVDHFQREETLMKKNNFPDTDAHMAEHHRIVMDLQSRLVAFEQNPSSGISGEIIDVLAAWANGHVLESDMQYRPFLTEQEPPPQEAAS